MSAIHDVAVIGAGPAGMAAAIRLRAAGATVLVLDEQPAPGGQIWRGVERAMARPGGAGLGADYAAGGAMARRFRESGADYRPGLSLWHAEALEQGWRIFASHERTSAAFAARELLLATGAQERPAPFPGWTLPGVLTVGAAQILLKTARQIPAEPVVVLGSGPLVLLCMVQLLDAGATIAAFLDTTPRGALRRALPHLPRAARQWRELAKGLGWQARLRRAGIRHVRDVEWAEATGDAAVQELRYRTGAGDHGRIAASCLLVHEGVIPQTHAAAALGCNLEWDEAQLCFRPRLGRLGETSVPGLVVAGDGGGIGGARAAGLAGELAALGALRRLGRLDAAALEQDAAPLLAARDAALATRPFLDALYRPRPSRLLPEDATVVCRCENLSAGQIRRAARIGQPGPNQVKGFTRCGMGPCQGRQCGTTLTLLLAEAQGRTPAEMGSLNIRPPLKPVTLREMALLAASPSPDPRRNPS